MGYNSGIIKFLDLVNIMKYKKLCSVSVMVLGLIGCSSNNAPISSANNPTIVEKSTVTNNSVFFDFNSADVGAKYNQLITLNAGYLIAHPNSRVQIQGNSSEVGAATYNQSLGMQRANNVRDALIKAGVKTTQISVISFGNTKLLYPSNNKGMQPKNQRADIVYTSVPPSQYKLGKIPTIDTSTMQ